MGLMDERESQCDIRKREDVEKSEKEREKTSLADCVVCVHVDYPAKSPNVLSNLK